MFRAKIVRFKFAGELRRCYLAGFLRRQVKGATAAVFMKRGYQIHRPTIHLVKEGISSFGMKSSKKLWKPF